MAAAVKSRFNGQPYRFGGLRIVALQDWPREFDHWETRYLPAHPHLVWLVERISWLPRSWAWFACRVPVWRDKAPFVAGTVVYCSPAQYEALKRATREEGKWLN